MFIHIKAKILLIIFHCIGIVSAYAQLYKPLETSDSLKKRVDIEIFQNSVNKYLFTLKFDPEKLELSVHTFTYGNISSDFR